MRHFVCFYCLTMIIIYYDLQKEKTYVLLHREFDHILNMQKYVTHFVSTFHGLKIDVGFNLALFIFRHQLLRCFSEREKQRQVSWLEPPLISTYYYYYFYTFQPVVPKRNEQQYDHIE